MTTPKWPRPSAKKSTILQRVSHDYLDKRLAEFEARFTWKIIGLFGVQIVIFLIAEYL